MAKTSAKKTTVSESNVTTTPAQVPEVATPPSKSASRSKKTEATPVATAPATPVVQESTPAKKGGKKAAAPVAAPVAIPEPTPVPVQEAGSSKKSKKAAAVAEPTVATPAAQPVVEQTGGEEATGTGRHKRFFRCVYRATDGSVVNAGRYSGKKPKQAAAKALTAIVKKNNVKTGESVTFLIQECTRGSRKKKYSYEGSQVFLPDPVQITIKKKDGTSSSISYAKNNLLKKIALTECGDLVNVELGEDEAQPQADVKVQAKATRGGRRTAGKAAAKTVKGGKTATRTVKAGKAVKA